MKSRGGYSLIEIMIVLMVLAILASLGIPSFLKIRESLRKDVCRENLRQIRQALSAYKFEHNFTGAVPDLSLPDLMPYMKGAALRASKDVYLDIGNVPYCGITNHDDRITLNLTAEDF